MCNLKDNLHRMTRVEINNLAKNRFIDADIQMYIADHAHLQARYYLADNEQLDNSVARAMWNGRSIVLKSLLVGNGSIEDQNEIREFYHKYINESGGINGRGKGFWRFRSTFIKNPWYQYRAMQIRTPNTPSDILLDIYQKLKSDLDKRDRGGYYYGTSGRYQFLDILDHKNLDLKTAIVMSTDKDPDVAKIAMKKMASLST